MPAGTLDAEAAEAACDTTGTDTVGGGQQPPSEAPGVTGVEPIRAGVAPEPSWTERVFPLQGRCGGVRSGSLRLTITDWWGRSLGSDVSLTFSVLVVNALEVDGAAVDVDDAAAAAVEVEDAAAAAAAEVEVEVEVDGERRSSSTTESMMAMTSAAVVGGGS